MAKLTRTYSSPNLKEHKYYFDNEEDEFYVIGDRVFVDGYKSASVAYFGELEFGQSGDWVGVVLDEPTGHHDGKVHGREYFQCAPGHGLFVRPHRVSRIPDSALGSSAASSRLSTPLPTFQRPCGRYSRSPGGNSSILDSYYYDEDYRQGPSIDSLERKLESIMSTSGSATTKSILKRPESSASGYSTSFAGRADELSRRIRATSTSPSRSPVFNFRPKRAQLNEFDSGSMTPQRPHRSPRRVELDIDKPLKRGDRVVVRLEKGSRELTGILRYLGEVEFAMGQWAGVELDQCEGKNDGSVLNRRYFYCPQSYGLFLPASRVRKCSRGEELQLSEHVRSTIFSPPPPRQASADSSRSATPNWKYTPTTTTTPSTGGSRPNSSSSGLFSPTTKIIDGYSKSSNTLGPNSWRSSTGRTELFNDNDIDYQLRKSLSKTITRPQVTGPQRIVASNIEQIKPKSVTYTFSSSKYDGCPIARRTVQY